jgi:hypothetical protein
MNSNIIHPTPTVQAIAWGLVEWGTISPADHRKLWACVQRELRKNEIFIRRVETQNTPFGTRYSIDTRYELWGEMRYHKGKQHWHRMIAPASTMQYACHTAMFALNVAKRCNNEPAE